MSEPYVSITAGPVLWGQIRRIAANAGCTLGESKGVLQRSFVLRGSAEQVIYASDQLAAMQERVAKLMKGSE